MGMVDIVGWKLKVVKLEFRSNLWGSFNIFNV